ncbi:hypothetical protein [Cellulomonas sp. URHD0024]|uniref:hypothetical protein n=1 Tax=Cellulomonas sp. URHD0024 TaxID=1302620 RepID=UPI0004173920|nr:hypothetical protein [Cellulomonas sp. URHD0024]
MEILPGAGVADVTIGDRRADVEERLGPPVHPGTSPRAVYRTDPSLVVSYDGDVVELVEIACTGGGQEVFFDGVQLSYRVMDDVVAELEAKGHRCTVSDVGFDVVAGFSLFSMSSSDARALDPLAGDADERAIVEGVSVAPYAYFVGT